MAQRAPRIVVTGVSDVTEEATNIIRTSKRLMVPELRASVRERFSNLRPGGLPPPGKTTQGFKGSQRSSLRESAKPQSFRTVRSFWRRLEGGAEPAYKRPQIAEKAKAPAWKLPVLRKTPNARESAKRKSAKKSSSIEVVKKSIKIEVKKPSIARQQSKKLSIGRGSYKKTSIEREPPKKMSIERGQSKKASLERTQSKKSSIQMEASRKISDKREQSIKMSTEKEPSIKREQSKKTSIERETSRKTTIERGKSGKTSTAREPSGKTSTVSDPFRKSTVEREQSKKISIERETPRKTTVEKEQFGKTSIEREPSRRTTVEKEQYGKSSIEREPSRKTTIEKEISDKFSIESEQPRISSIEREPSKKSSMGMEQAEKSFIREQSKRKSDEITKLSITPSRKSTLTQESEKASMTKAPSRLIDSLQGTQASEQSYNIGSTSSVKSKQPSISTLPPPDIDFDHGNLSKLSKQGTISSTQSVKRSIISINGPSLEQVKEEDLEERIDEEEKGDKMEETEEVDEVNEGQVWDEEEEMDEEEEEEEEERDDEEEDEENEVESDIDEEMEEEEEEVPSEARPKIAQETMSPPTAGLRPSSLWATLPRIFSEESLNRPSVILPVLLEEEKLFHELVAGGDVSAVSDFISKRPKFNINCENYQGTSALHIAVKEDNEDMVQYLLSLPGIEVRDSHLFAIRDNHPGILIMILDKLQTISPALEFMACSNSPEFAENITPLILAAEAGHFEIVGLLISRGHVIPRPHKPRCFCKEECQAIMKSQDILSISSGKLHIYRALSNPAYLCQTSPDPLLIAFKLSKELLTCGHVDTIYLRQYETLAESLRAFAVDLIAECRTLEEVETILSESKDSKLKGDWRYPRLILAMDYKQKEFIAHPNVQQVLERTWMGDWIEWRAYRVYVKALYVFPRLVTLPVVLVILMFMPTSKWAKHFSLPVNKLLSNVASYCIFLMLVFVQSNVNKKNQTRDTKPTGVEVFLVIYVLTFVYNSIRSLLRQGVHRFFKFMWNIYELVMEFFFIMAFIFLIVAEIKTTIKGDKDLERKYWNYMDPELISESFFVLAAVMAFMRILLIFQISYHLGPLQVSLGKMTNDCAMFSVIFAIIIIAYTAGLCKFYSYYEDMVQTNPETGDVESSQVSSFTSVLDTFKTLFWGLFGMSSFDVADVIIENTNEGNTNSTTMNEHHLTEAVGYFAFATYMILTVIVILNMLIATMSNTFQKVTDNVDTEWLFGRTEVYISYIDLPVLPPPFNIIPTTHTIVSLVKGNRPKGGKLIGVDVEKGIIDNKENIRNDDYYVLMSQLVQRYFSTKNSEND